MTWIGNWNTNSYSNEFKSYREVFIIIVVLLKKSVKGFDSGKKHELDIWTLSNIKTFELTRICHNTFRNCSKLSELCVYFV